MISDVDEIRHKQLAVIFGRYAYYVEEFSLSEFLSEYPEIEKVGSVSPGVTGDVGGGVLDSRHLVQLWGIRG